MKSSLFEKVFVINIPRRVGRIKEWSKNNFNEIGFHPIVRIDGIDAKALDLEVSLFSKKTCLSAGQIGAFLSHLIAMEMASGEMLPSLVTEDDAILSEGFVEKLERILTNSDWDIVRFSDRSKGYGIGTCGYIVKPNIARSIRRWIMGASSVHIDLALTEMEHSGLLKVNYVPSLINHGGTMTSDTTSKYGHDRNDISANELMEKQFSQYEEDKIIPNFFREIWKDDPGRKGRFLEIGAMDGVQYSNCRKLALMGWSGVCVEPNPFLYVRLFRNYHGTSLVQTVCACVGPTQQLRTLHLNDDGLSTTDASVFNSLKDRVGFYGHCISPTITPDDLVGLFGNNFDFVSIDAEGMDMAIVESSAKLLEKTSLICVETDEPGQPRSESYQAKWKMVLDKSGFTKVVHQTQGNTILTRP